MINAYSDIVSYTGDDFEDYLTKICLIDIFKDLIPLFKDKAALKQAIHYIVMCYSKDSDCIVLGSDWLGNKKRAFDKCLIHLDYYQDLVLLENRIIIKVIQKWLEFQDSTVFAELTMLLDLQLEMRLSANSKILKTDGVTVDFDQKYKNACYVKDLRIMIEDLEQELVQNDIRLKEGVQEVKKAGKNKFTIGAETFSQ